MPTARLVRPRRDREVGVAHLRRDGARAHAAALAATPPGPRHPPQVGVELLAVAHVDVERLLVRDRDGLGRLAAAPGAGRSRGRAARSSTPTRPGSSSASRASSSSASAPIVATPAADEPHLAPWAPPRAACAPPATPGTPPPRRRGTTVIAARLSGVRRDLRDDLAGRDAQRAREPHPLAHGQLHELGLLARVAVGQHEVALVDPDLLDHRRHLAHERPHPARPLPVGLCGRAARTPPAGSGGGPRRSTSPSGCRSGAPRSSPSPRRRARRGCRRRHGLAPQPRVPVELHRREECVEVEMRDHECNLTRSGARSGRGRNASGRYTTAGLDPRRRQAHPPALARGVPHGGTATRHGARREDPRRGLFRHGRRGVRAPLLR